MSAVDSRPPLTLDLDALRWDARGLVPVVAQERSSGAVLMVAWADRGALERTLAERRAWFWSRSRGELWRKGASSGNELEVLAARADCDGDTVLLAVRAAGPACHTGRRTCFGDGGPALELGWLAEVVAARRGADPDTSYTARLLGQGFSRAAQKVGEEGVETALAAVDPSLPPERLAEEAADLLFHLLVLLEARGVPAAAVAAALDARHREPAAEPEAAR